VVRHSAAAMWVSRWGMRSSEAVVVPHEDEPLPFFLFFEIYISILIGLTSGTQPTSANWPWSVPLSRFGFNLC
jgi:hypothetical protein